MGGSQLLLAQRLHRGFIGSVTFETATPCLGTPAPGTISSRSSVLPRTGLPLSPQNATLVQELLYQWLSASSLAGPYTQ
jgi:hypothetical protein